MIHRFNHKVLSSSETLVIIMTLKTFEIDTVKLDEMVNAASPGGPFENRLLYHILAQFQTMGYAWRDDWNVILYNEDHEGLTSECYAEYLDKKACGDAVWFDPAANDGKGEILFAEPVLEEE